MGRTYTQDGNSAEDDMDREPYHTSGVSGGSAYSFGGANDETEPLPDIRMVEPSQLR